jgi:hypothetical protein
MNKRRNLLAMAAMAAIALGGCVSQSQMIQAKQSTAVETALQRGRFDLNCPAATGTVLSSDFIQPAVQGPWVGGLNRVEYTVGVEGCGQRRVYVVLCQTETATCFAAHPSDRFQAAQ